MSPLCLRFLEHVHGHIGWLCTLALFHPAILLRRPRRRALAAAAAATALATLSGILGASLYPSYRVVIKPQLFSSSPAIGYAFERKEHFAIAVIVLAWVGLGAHWAEHRKSGRTVEPGRVAFVAYAGAAILATLTAGLGLLVAANRTF